VNKKFGLFGIISIAIIVIFSIILSQNSENNDLQTSNLTGTPADNYSETEREKFCGTSTAKSTLYVKEYDIPTSCTQPQAITVGPQGNIWFAQSNTGNLAKFNPLSESITEYDNTLWPKGDNSMIWGLDYHDGFLFFTDDKHDSVWKYQITTQEYSRLNNTIFEDSFPQRLHIVNSTLYINDLTGGKIVILDLLNPEKESYSITSSDDSFMGDFFINSKNHLWYTNWNSESGILGVLNQPSSNLPKENEEGQIEMQFFSLPEDLQSSNGKAEDDNENIWIADSSSSLIFKFERLSQTFYKYTTAKAPASTYGNYTGQTIAFSSNPYWIDKTESGKIVFNEVGANRIGLIDPDNESIIGYSVPSQNPHWGDCVNLENCGAAQIFDIVIHDEKIWFSEWAENKIGVVDTTIPLPIDVKIDQKRVSLSPGNSVNTTFILSSESKNNIGVYPIVENPDVLGNLIVMYDDKQKTELNSENPLSVKIKITSSENAQPGEYKVLLGGYADDVYLGEFLTVVIQ
jgi:virginiamycin B lyase